jgi:alcohol dehydrogenase
MVPFDFHCPTRIVFGPDTIDRLGELAAELAARRTLVVSDPGIISAGHTARGVESLRRAGVDGHVFEGVHENPTTRDVERGLQAARDVQPDLIVGLGGGSSMDCAKGINFLLTGGGRMQDYWGVGKARHPMLPMIAAPTTAGTGSEAQSFALISDADTHVKMACGDKKAAFRVAILDPRLTLTQPPRVTALTGLDAIAHAVETYVTKPRNAASLAYSREAWYLLSANFSRVLQDPDNLQGRSGMQLGACFAGLAIENSMLGATHALANPLTAHYGIAHGKAIGLMLPHVIRFNGQVCAHLYEEMVQVLDGAPGAPEKGSGAEGLAQFIAAMARQSGIPAHLRDCGVEASRIPTLAADAACQWTGQFNPRPINEEDCAHLYRQAFRIETP